MKPLKLKLKGLNSFIEEQTIDFEKLTEKGLFGIFGPTGSGKSTILDGITLCLYGEVARKSTNYINTNGELLHVSFEFQISHVQSKRYRAEREFKRNKTGSILTKSARILDITNGEEILLEERTRQVTSKCEEIIGLNLDDFTRTVVLPQGKFSEFLKLQGKERRDMLERLFHLGKYGDGLSQKLALEIRQYRTKESELIGELKGFEGISEEIINQKKQDLEKIQVELEKSRREIKIIEEAYHSAKELWSQQEDLNTYTQELDKLKLREEEMKQGQLKLSLGESAIQVKPYIERYETLQLDIESVEKKLEENQVQFEKINLQREKIKEEYEKANQDKEEKLPQFNIKHTRLEDAVKIQELLDQLIVEKEILQKSLFSLEREIVENSRVDIELQKRIDRTHGEIINQEEEIERRKVPHEYKEKLWKALSLQDKIQTSTKNRLQIKKDMEQLQRKIEEDRNQNNIYQSELETQLEYIQTMTNQYEYLVKSCPGDHELLQQKSAELYLSKQSWRAYRDYSASLLHKEKSLESMVQRFHQKEKEKESLAQEVDHLEGRVEEHNKENIAQLLRETLKEGESCPVCGSQDHLLESIPHRDLAGIKELKDQMELHKKSVNELIRELTTVEANRETEQKSIESIKKDIENLGTDFMKTKDDVLQGEFDALQKSISEYASKKSELENVLSTAKDNKNELQVKIGALEGSVNQNQEQYQKVKVNLEQISQEQKKDGELFNQYKLDLKVTDLLEANVELIKKEKESDELQKSIKKLRERIVSEQNEKEKLVENGSRTKEIHTEKRVELEEKTRSINEKRGSILEKVGQVIDVRVALKEIIRQIEIIKSHYLKMERKKSEIDEGYNQIKDQIIIDQNNLQTLQKQMFQSKTTLQVKLKEQNFETIEEAKERIIPLEEIRQLQKELENYNNLLNQWMGARDSIIKKIDGRSLPLEKWKQMQIEREDKNSTLKELESLQSTLDSEVKEINRRFEEQKSVLREKEKVDGKLGLLDDLEKLFKGKRFVEYVAAHQLQYVSMEASKKLKEITGGNYGLEADENGKFIIRDYKNGGAMRDASTLSGGETFLASLALALALSAQIQLKGTAPLELFFLDEGFGTLDDNMLEVVMDSLETIHHDRLSIGIISHVESIKNRVPIKLVIEPAVSGLGGSKAKIEYS